MIPEHAANGAAVNIDTLMARIRGAVRQSTAPQREPARATAGPGEEQAEFNRAMVEALASIAEELANVTRAVAERTADLDSRLTRGMEELTRATRDELAEALTDHAG